MSPGGRQRTNMVLGGLFVVDVSIYPAGSTIFSAWLIAELIIRRLLPSSCHYIFSPFNYPQRLSTAEVVTGLKLVELIIARHLPNLPWREVAAQRREGVDRALSEA